MRPSLRAALHAALLAACRTRGDGRVQLHADPCQHAGRHCRGAEFVESQLGTENILCPLFLSGVILPKRASEQADTEEETKVEDIASQQVF